MLYEISQVSSILPWFIVNLKFLLLILWLNSISKKGLLSFTSETTLNTSVSIKSS
ncbi:hypothetical protein NWQ34_01400 [Mycoplasmopsis felis]|uniref:hypothetical protein n=1 Tax=Mycoplasmopsis felis TaxID=33923 RepID=UPI0021E0629E|nr:hypothetical protein [Mycoplasmopsis felis]MCU9938352.1 hypothetical protein [Mycoplasmopsis felis]